MNTFFSNFSLLGRVLFPPVFVTVAPQVSSLRIGKEEMKENAMGEL